ncbi:MAG: hypothetical protein IPL53_07550 [Ignavibacteria bacterium]|nr:hypothetical protein [Ignavibacteria bacterium]
MTADLKSERFLSAGRDYNAVVDNTGIGIIIFSIFGIAVHSLIRLTSRKKKDKVS